MFSDYFIIPSSHLHNTRIVTSLERLEMPINVLFVSLLHRWQWHFVILRMMWPRHFNCPRIAPLPALKPDELWYYWVILINKDLRFFSVHSSEFDGFIKYFFPAISFFFHCLAAFISQIHHSQWILTSVECQKFCELVCRRGCISL